MFPYESWWRWYIGGKHAHLIEATREHLDQFHEPYRRILRNRAKRMEFALKVRLFFLVLLNLGLIGTALTGLAAVLPVLEGLEHVLGPLAQTLGAFTLGLTALVLLATRHLGQLEADMVASMVLGTPGAPRPSRDDEAQVRAQEEGSEPPWKAVADRVGGGGE